MPDGESLVRQLLLGKRYFKQKFGVEVRIGWNPDSFGYNWQLPQIYKKSGMDYFVTQKLFWNDTNKPKDKLFWWQAPDGSRVLTYLPHDYANDIDPVRMATDLASYSQQTQHLDELMHLYGVGDHGDGSALACACGGGLTWDGPSTSLDWSWSNRTTPFASATHSPLLARHCKSAANPGGRAGSGWPSPLDNLDWGHSLRAGLCCHGTSLLRWWLNCLLSTRRLRLIAVEQYSRRAE